jgi:hypothetical protein
VAWLIPKLRHQFAEFLNQSSLDRLGILYLTTCVGLGYGYPRLSLEAFLGSMASVTSTYVSASCLRRDEARISLVLALHTYPGATNARVHLASSVTPSVTY